jgi:hypothetical protein
MFYERSPHPGTHGCGIKEKENMLAVCTYSTITQYNPPQTTLDQPKEKRMLRLKPKYCYPQLSIIVLLKVKYDSGWQWHPKGG